MLESNEIRVRKSSGRAVRWLSAVTGGRKLVEPLERIAQPHRQKSCGRARRQRGAEKVDRRLALGAGDDGGRRQDPGPCASARIPEAEEARQLCTRQDTTNSQTWCYGCESHSGNMHSPLSFVFLLLTWTLGVSAQFQFFEHMFGGGGHHHHQQPQNMPSDSSWYQQQYDTGKLVPKTFLPNHQSAEKRITCQIPTPSMLMLTLVAYSHLRQIPLPRHAFLRALSTSLPMRVSGRRRQSRAG